MLVVKRLFLLSAYFVLVLLIHLLSANAIGKYRSRCLPFSQRVVALH